MSDVLLVQNTRIEGSGYLGTLLNDDGFDIQSVIAKNENLPEKQFSLVVILGAPESANDDLPYLREEQKLIKRCVSENIPVLRRMFRLSAYSKNFWFQSLSWPEKRNRILS